MARNVDENNPNLSVEIGVDRKRRIVAGAKKDGLTPTQYINKMIDTWFEVIEQNAK